MKRLLYVSTIYFLFINCGYELPTQYACIEETVRNIVFVYDNNGLAEGAPGDTVGVNAYFAGDNISNVQWSISTGVVYGTFLEKDSLIDSMDLTELMVPGTYQKSHGITGDTIHFDIVIPKNIIRKQYGNVASVSSLMPAGLDKKTTEALDSVSPSELINVLEMLANNPGQFDSEMINSIIYSVFKDSTDNVWNMFSYVLQALTVNMRLFVEVNGDHKVESFLGIRYNHKLKYLNSKITVNRNPGISQVCLEVIGPSGSKKNLDTVIVLNENENNVIDIYRDCSYYLTVSVNGSVRDSVMEYHCDGKRSLENYISEWFYKNNTSLPDANKEELLIIEKKITSSEVRLLPPVDTRMKNFCIWVVITDYFFGERLRPSGFAIKGFHGRFRYLKE